MDNQTHYGVYPFSIAGQPDKARGYVSRPCFADGRCHDTRNYGGVKPVRVFKRAYAADRLAMRMTFPNEQTA